MSSPFASQRGGWQDDVLAAFDDPEHPETARGNLTWIHYSVSDVYLTSWFGRCLAAELNYRQRAYVDGDPNPSPWAYRETDAAPWGAERAWQLYDEENEQWHDHWLITSGTRIVEFISSDLEMTDARMAIVGEKLLNADIK